MNITLHRIHLNISLLNGPSVSLTMSAICSVFIKMKQQDLPSLSQLITASLSPGFMPAFSRSSFGNTIWPRSSTVTTDSTWQQAAFPVLQHDAFFTFAINHPLFCHTPLQTEYLIDHTKIRKFRTIRIIKLNSRVCQEGSSKD